MNHQTERTWAEIDLDNIVHNMKAIRAHVAPRTKFLGVVKADAYGHGAREVAARIEDLADWFAVATPEEGLSLRRSGIKRPIMILGYSQREAYEDLIREDVTPVLFKEEDAAVLSETALRLGAVAGYQVKLDCGMGRIGFLPGEEAVMAIRRMSAMPGLSLRGIFTHFSRADEADKGPVMRQLAVFLSMKERLERAGVQPEMWHCDNSAGIIDLPQAGLSLVRAGIAMYGMYPSDEVSRENVSLLPALSLRAKIVHVKTLPAGCGISYNATCVTERETRVATVPLGYGDGWPRSLSGKGVVLVRGKRAPILGRVCMDQFMIDITDIPEARDGDTVTLIGADGNERISAEEAAARAGTINYELVCCLGRRVPRVYVLDGETVGRRDDF